MRRSLTTRRRIALLLSLVVLVTAGSAVAAVAASSSPVKVGDDYFSVKHLTVQAGAKVSWKWVGVLDHNVTVKSGPMKFASRTQATGTFSHVFTKPGTYTLYCTIHPTTMRMVVVVR